MRFLHYITTFMPQSQSVDLSLNNPQNHSAYRRDLLDWFYKNQRVLPWRQNPSLYKTVLSEFMLQQTQVVTVIPYFERWLNELPSFEATAAASEEKLCNSGKV